MEGIINLHHDLMFFITFIFFFVLVVMVRTLHSFRFNLGISSSDSRLVVHGTAIEIIWTVIPSLILVVVALPSFALLYSIDEVINPALTLKCIGHQWYWSYEYSDFDNTLGSINFDSYMVAEDELEHGELRLLEVDNRIVLPVNTHLRLLVTAADVLHSFAIPSLGIKLRDNAEGSNEISINDLSDAKTFMLMLNISIGTEYSLKQESTIYAELFIYNGITQGWKNTTDYSYETFLMNQFGLSLGFLF